MKALYLILDLGTLSIPLLWSFGPKIRYYRKWRALFPAILITAVIFIIWDIIFTEMGVWGFTQSYLLGSSIAKLPVEEWLFFICIPYSSLFIYESLRYFVSKDILGPVRIQIAWVLALGSLMMALIFFGKSYTMTAFGSLAVLLLLHLFWLPNRWLGRFFLAYLIVLIPFFIVNGILTGTGIEAQVVWYDNAENLGIRLGTIPVEDTFYGMALLLMNVSLYETFLRRKQD